MRSDPVAHTFIQSSLETLTVEGLHSFSAQLVHGAWILNHFQAVKNPIQWELLVDHFTYWIGSLRDVRKHASGDIFITHLGSINQLGQKDSCRGQKGVFLPNATQLHSTLRVKFTFS